MVAFIISADYCVIKTISKKLLFLFHNHNHIMDLCYPENYKFKFSNLV